MCPQIFLTQFFRVVWKSLLVLYAKDVLTDLVTIHHGQPRWQYCTQVSSTLFGEAVARLFLASKPSMTRRDIAKEVSNCLLYVLMVTKSISEKETFCSGNPFCNGNVQYF